MNPPPRLSQSCQVPPLNALCHIALSWPLAKQSILRVAAFSVPAAQSGSEVSPPPRLSQSLHAVPSHQLCHNASSSPLANTSSRSLPQLVADGPEWNPPPSDVHVLHVPAVQEICHIALSEPRAKQSITSTARETQSGSEVNVIVAAWAEGGVRAKASSAVTASISFQLSKLRAAESFAKSKTAQACQLSTHRIP